jgi:hypothetical protein
VKRKFTGKRSDFTTSTEAHLALGIISQSRNPDWQGELLKSLDNVHSRQNAARSSGTLNKRPTKKREKETRTREKKEERDQK